MLYFFHHYELPVILQQAQLQHLLFRNHAQAGMAEQPSPEQPISNRALTEPTPEPSPARESTTENQAQQATSSAQQGPESTNPSNAEERVEATPSSSTNEEQSNEGNQRESKFFHNRFHLSCVCVCMYFCFFLFVFLSLRVGWRLFFFLFSTPLPQSCDMFKFLEELKYDWWRRIWKWILLELSRNCIKFLCFYY